MSKYTIAIPHSLYEKAQRLAKHTSQSVDEIICTRLEGALDQPLLDLPSDERAELHAILEYGDKSILAFLSRSGSGAKYEGPNVMFWEKGGEVQVTWFGQDMQYVSK